LGAVPKNIIQKETPLHPFEAFKAYAVAVWGRYLLFRTIINLVSEGCMALSPLLQ